jgi:glucose/mannose-6-phosphate isomerase|tara:strand:+ start:1091 stop:2098 length:1008 start_codon:yes stop_codon:yes gene_type:complete
MEISDLKKIDGKRMFETYDNWPNISSSIFETKIKKIDIKDVDHIVFAGMGGSGSLGDVMSSILSKEDIHVSVVKGYHLPNTINTNSLVVTTSISGNTKETISILRDAYKRDAKIAAFSSGGKMEEFCNMNNIFYESIPMIHSPRASFPKFLFTILKSLEQIIPVKENDMKEAIVNLEKTKKNISSKNLTNSNISLKLASWIRNMPLIYYPWGLQSAAIRFKNALQENAKIHVVTEDIVESCHNGIVAWESKSQVQPVLIKGKDDYVKTIERWDILQEFFREKEIDYFEIKSIEGSILSKIVNLIFLLDYSSIYHAVLNKIDPSPVKAIDFVKERL